VPFNVALSVALGLFCAVVPGFETFETVAVKQTGSAERVDRLTFLPPHVAEGTALGRTVDMTTGAIGSAPTDEAPFLIAPLRDRWTFLARQTEISLPAVRSEASSAWLEAAPVTALTTPVLAFAAATPSSVLVPERAAGLSSRDVAEVVPVRIDPSAVDLALVLSKEGALSATGESVPVSAVLPDASVMTGEPSTAGAKATPEPAPGPGVTKGRLGEPLIGDRSAPGAASKPVGVSEPVRPRRSARPAASAPAVPKSTAPWSPFEASDIR
jgi:hypothetical protein